MKNDNWKALWKLLPAVMVVGAMATSGAYGEKSTEVSAAKTNAQVIPASEIATLLEYETLEEADTKENDKASSKSSKSGKINSSSSKRSLPSASQAGGGAAGSGLGSTYTPRVEIPASGYQDGTYQGSGTGFGGTISVSVTISGGKIASIQVLDASSETASFFASASAVLNRIMEAQSPNVDAVSGATYSSNGLIRAVQNALSKAAASGDTEVTEDITSTTLTPTGTSAATPTAAPGKTPVKTPSAGQETEEIDGYQDGTYTGTGTGFSGTVKLTATITDGVIQHLTAEHTDTPVFFNTAWEVLQSEILQKQSLQEIDTVSGATYSSNGILEAMGEILGQAAYSVTPTPKPTASPSPTKAPSPTRTPSPTVTPDGNESPDLPENSDGTVTPEATPNPGLTPQPDQDATPSPEATPQPDQEATPNPEATPQPDQEATPEPEVTPEPEGPYMDGTYTGTAWGYLGKVTVTVNISGGQIVSITETNKDTADYYYSAWNQIFPAVMSQQSADGIDTVSGATYSSEGILESIQNALAQAKR